LSYWPIKPQIILSLLSGYIIRGIISNDDFKIIVSRLHHTWQKSLKMAESIVSDDDDAKTEQIMILNVEF
jgi:hypothetical protein